MSENEKCPSVRGVKYVSVHGALGYHTAAKRYILGLKNSKIPVTWTPMLPGRTRRMGCRPLLGREIEDPELSSVCNIQIEYDTLIVHTVPEYYPIWARKEPGKRLIGYTVWETDRIPDHWTELLNTVDHVLVPTHWNKKVFESCGVTASIHVIPHIIGEAAPQDLETTWEIEPDDYVFYTIGAWTARKAIWNTIRSYLESFGAQDSTVLVIKTTNKDLTKRNFLGLLTDTARAVQRIVKDYPNPAKIRLIRDELDEEDILKLHFRGDCYVSLCRSEGWGLGAFDAAGYGRPVIMTGFGGQVEYLPPDLAFLVNYRTVPVLDRIGRVSYSKNQNWAEPDIIHASRLMRWVFEHKRQARAKGEKLKRYVRDNFGENVVIQKLIFAIAGA